MNYDTAFSLKDVTYNVNLQLFADYGRSQHTTNHFLTLFPSNGILFSNTLSNVKHFFYENSFVELTYTTYYC